MVGQVHRYAGMPERRNAGTPERRNAGTVAVGRQRLARTGRAGITPGRAAG
jgi:hypothetical protein